MGAPGAPAALIGDGAGLGLLGQGPELSRLGKDPADAMRRCILLCRLGPGWLISS